MFSKPKRRRQMSSPACLKGQRASRVTPTWNHSNPYGYIHSFIHAYAPHIRRRPAERGGVCVCAEVYHTYVSNRREEDEQEKERRLVCFRKTPNSNKPLSYPKPLPAVAIVFLVLLLPNPRQETQDKIQNPANTPSPIGPISARTAGPSWKRPTQQTRNSRGVV